MAADLRAMVAGMTGPVLGHAFDVEHTAPTAGRPLFARLLRQVGHLDAAAYFDRSAEHWRAIVRGTGRAAFGFEDLARLVAAIADEETAGVAAVRAALGDA